LQYLSVCLSVTYLSFLLTENWNVVESPYFMWRLALTITLVNCDVNLRSKGIKVTVAGKECKHRFFRAYFREKWANLHHNYTKWSAAYSTQSSNTFAPAEISNLRYLSAFAQSFFENSGTPFAILLAITDSTPCCCVITKIMAGIGLMPTVPPTDPLPEVTATKVCLCLHARIFFRKMPLFS